MYNDYNKNRYTFMENYIINIEKRGETQAWGSF